MGLTKRWTVKKKNDYWVVYDRGIAWNCYNTLAEAHTEATQNAVADTLYAPGGLTTLKYLIGCAR